MKTLDNPLYYLDNFRHALDWIGERYADLLDAEETAFVAGFPALAQPAQALLVRMVMRKGPLFLSAKLRYDEIGCPHAAAAPLAERGWVDPAPLLTADDLFALLGRPELERVFAGMPGARGMRKPEWRDAVRAAAPDARRFEEWHPQSPDRVYALTAGRLCDRLRLFYFGNLHQDWSEFVISELGILRYETVPFPPESRGFQCRADIDDYLALYRCRERFDAGEAVDDLVPEVLSVVPGNDWIARRRGRLLADLAYTLEQHEQYQDALALYRQAAAPGARLRSVRVLEKLGRHGEAHALAAAAAAAPEDEAERQAVQRCLPRLARRLGLAPPALARTAPVERIDLALPRPADGTPVEFLVRDHLSAPATPVFYVENTLLNGLFGLLCWPAIFAAVPGAFFHPFQAAPADLHATDFRARRSDLFDACLARLADGSHADAIRATWRDKHGLQSPFVAWDHLDETLLDLALDCIPPAHLRATFERLLADIKSNRSGFPDLVCFDPARRGYRMIEVKGPGDRLQDNQLRFIDHCARHGMPVAVCHVAWAEDA